MEFSPDTPKVGQNVRMSFIDCIIEATVVGRRALDDTPNEPSTAEWINLSDGNTVRRHEGGRDGLLDDFGDLVQANPSFS